MTFMAQKGIKPLNRLIEVIFDDKHDLSILLVYTLMSGLLSLVVPLGAQALVNTIAAGVFLQPLVVLSGLVLLGLIFYGVIQLIELHIIEKLQQRIFTKVSFKLSSHIPRIMESELKEKYAPDLVNRFFDTMTVQKGWSKILMQGPSSILQIIIGLSLMAVYSPYLILFDLIVIMSMCVIICVGKNGTQTSVDESTEKYNVAEWLEELGRCHLTFKLNSSREFLLEQTDLKVMSYLKRRSKHYRVLFRQYVAYFLFYALSSTGLLAIGGWLVINQKLGLGQLVAAELVMLNILKATESLLSRLDTYYDLLASLDKIGSVTDMKTERTTGAEIERLQEGIDVKCQSLSFSYDATSQIINNLSMHIAPGERVSLVGKSGSGKTTLASLICGLQELQSGIITIDKMDVRDCDLESMRSQVSLVGNSNEIFSGTIEENIIVGTKNITRQALQEAIDTVALNVDLANFPKGLQTKLMSEGLNISLGQRLRILIARAILKKPRLLILDEAFIGTDEKTKLIILDNILDRKHLWTVIDISHDAESVVKSDITHVLREGRIVESGKPKELAMIADSVFSRLFPELTRQIKNKLV